MQIPYLWNLEYKWGVRSSKSGVQSSKFGMTSTAFGVSSIDAWLYTHNSRLSLLRQRYTYLHPCLGIGDGR